MEHLTNVNTKGDYSLFMSDEVELNQCDQQTEAPAPFEKIGQPNKRTFVDESSAHNDARYVANDNLNNVALTLVYSGEVAITIDNALSEIKQALQQLRELSIKSVQQRVAVELRNLQKDVDKYLQKIEFYIYFLLFKSNVALACLICFKFKDLLNAKCRGFYA